MAYKILVVDDEPDWEDLIKQRFEKQTCSKEWEFFFTRNGLEALDKVKEIPDISVILLDLKMPEMDGLTFLKKLNKMDNPIIKVIVITGYGDMENIRNAMNDGAFDFLIKPIQFDDLKKTIEKALKQIDNIKKSLKEHDELVALKKELEITSHIQESMVPRKFPPFPKHKEFDIFAKMIPAREVGGDFYDFFFVDPERLAFVVGDVSGKGLSAAMYMAKCCTLLKTTAIKVGHPGECLYRVNEQLMREKESDSNLSVTIFHGVLNIRTGIVDYSSAGHPAPYIVNSNREVAQLEAVGDNPLCYFENRNYEAKKIQINKGDILLIYTDGVTEAMNAQDKEFVDDNLLLKYLKGVNIKSLEGIVEDLINEIKEFASGAPQYDDITILALRYN